MSTIDEYAGRPFGTLSDLIRLQAQARPSHPAVICEGEHLDYAGFDRLIDRVAAALQRDGVMPGDIVSICSLSSIAYTAVFLGTLRAGAAIAPLAPSATPEQLKTMIADCGARHLFLDREIALHLAPVMGTLSAEPVALEPGAPGTPFEDWLAPEGARPAPVEIDPDQPFNIIYSSGTTGTPKGIVQPHRMRWHQISRMGTAGYGAHAVAILSTPLYSNTTLVSFIPALAGGGTVVLMRKFDARTFLELCQTHRVTHAMLVPVQYRRILDVPDFDSFDLSSFEMKYCTSAPFPAEHKAEVLRRWPGGLTEFYGMTEGGGSCALLAHEHPDKLHTVGQPIQGHEIRIIDPDGNSLPPGEVGEIVGRSSSIMIGYHNQPAKTAEAEWYSPEGERFIRTGDLGAMDEEGFVTLIGRKKDMIISGGFNIYPVDIEQVLVAHPFVREAAVVGVPSVRWGETPVAFVTLEAGTALAPEELREWANGQLNKTQRLAEIRVIDVLPRSAIGKVLKRELQDAYANGA